MGSLVSGISLLLVVGARQQCCVPLLFNDGCGTQDQARETSGDDRHYKGYTGDNTDRADYF